MSSHVGHVQACFADDAAGMGARLLAFETNTLDHDDRLFDALAEREAWAIREVYVAHARAVKRLIGRLLQDDAEADDVVHDLFVELPKAMKSFRRESSLRTFLCSIAVRMAGKRRLKKATMTELSFVATAVASGDPQVVLEQNQLAQALREALKELPFELARFGYEIGAASAPHRMVNE